MLAFPQNLLLFALLFLLQVLDRILNLVSIMLTVQQEINTQDIRTQAQRVGFQLL